ncbi:hypothetical protein SAVIM338S_06636 [Streptomyces avidinii]
MWGINASSEDGPAVRVAPTGPYETSGGRKMSEACPDMEVPFTARPVIDYWPEIIYAIEVLEPAGLGTVGASPARPSFRAHR